MRVREIVLSLLVAGCSVDRSGLAYAIPAAADAGLDADVAVADGSFIDSPSFDAAVPADAGREPRDAAEDAFADAAPLDAAPDDAGAADAGTDAGRDAGPEDGGPPDGGPPDSGPAELDAGPPVGCADDSIEQRYEDTAGDLVMVGCDGARDQCTAEMLCAPGWHLCNQAEYAAHGGDGTPATAARWLAGCLRLGNCTSTGGSSAICGDCSVEGGAPLAIFGNACPGVIRLESVECPVGVIASTMDGRYRLDGYPECMYAEVAVTDMALGATCCR